jgi:hypothetical protein
MWWHVLCVIVPDRVDFAEEAFIWITGDNNDGGNISNLTDWLPKANDEDIFVAAYLAMHTNTVGAALFQVCDVLHRACVSTGSHGSRTRSMHTHAWVWYK